MTWISAVPAWCWWLIALVIVAGGQEIRVGAGKSDASAARTELADYRLQVSERDRRAAAVARTEEQRRQAVADEEGESARQKLEMAQGRAVAAEYAAGGLRGEIARLRDGRAATCDTITAQQRQAEASAVVVLGGLLEESDRMAGDLAKALERSRIAGLTCESIYSVISREGR
ncbi:DUF2514 domain-containing protein [Pseudomonas sp. BT-42-2]|uniref:DUF2514 domain-containing protein n=1 Tax=Pseudomonas sp. BT-42-2 TaxID=2986927 RepID=UPI0021F7209F|nr:DUF2514 domain-containing protein [Pseudomonas sp. BT-42-2]MCV9917825.1 DUF2514 domain-containing protein [Pseudomonas sp. BT-42-2]